MAGRGDLAALRLLRELRNKSGSRISYGAHMVLNSAIGLLFLAGGTATLSRSDSSIAALLCAFCPRYPTSPTDNYTHLQSFRHLYVLAADYRMLDFVDVNTSASLLVPLHVDLSCGKTIEMRSPCLLPEVSSIRAIRVDSERYWPLTLERAKISEDSMRRVETTENRSKGWTIELKRRVAHLSYEQDPLGLRSLLSRLLPEDIQRRRKAIEEFIDAFDLAPEVRIFAQQFVGLASGTELFSGYDDEHSQFCSAILYECLANDKLEMMQTYFEIQETQRSMLRLSSSCMIEGVAFTQKYWNLKLAFAVFEGKDEMGEFRKMKSSAVEFLEGQGDGIVRKYLKDEKISESEGLMLSLLLMFFEIPLPISSKDSDNVLKDIVSAVLSGNPESLFDNDLNGSSSRAIVHPCSVVKIMEVMSSSGEN